MFRVLFTILLLTICFSGFSQEIAIGDWRVHFPYNKGNSVCDDGVKVYLATPSGLFYYDKQDESIERLSKLNGLSDQDANVLYYSPNTKDVYVGYKNGNIDIIHKDGSISNISDIKRKQLTADKSINEFYEDNNLLYVSCGFGIVVLDLKKLEVKDSFLLGINGAFSYIYQTCILNNNLYAATDSGLYYAPLNLNLADFSVWKRELKLPRVRINTLATGDNKIIVNSSPPNSYDKDSLFIFSDGSWRKFNNWSFSCKKLSVVNAQVYWVGNFEINILNFAGEKSAVINYFQLSNAASPKQVIISGNDAWIADAQFGLLKYDGTNFSGIIPNGPSELESSKIINANGAIYVASAAIPEDWSNSFKKYGVYKYDGFSWSIINEASDANMKDMVDIYTIRQNPTKPEQIMVASWFNGIAEVENDKVVKRFVYLDSIQKINLDPIFDPTCTLLRYYRCGVGGVDFDADGNLWMTNTNSLKPLHVKTTDGKWYAFPLNGFNNNSFIGDLVLDDYGQKWMQIPRGVGIVVYNDNNTIDNATDDQQIMLTQIVGKGGMHTTDIYAITKDLNGEIWVGTDKGVTVFHSPGSVFESGANFDAQQIKIEQNGVVGYLLESETVTSITVDKANRKWIGTANAGVFLVSADGTEQLESFNINNSPLPSNSILSVGINDENGEVFIGTAKGIVSYKGTATSPTIKNEGVYAYPNPVKPDYTGVIAIKNLVADANIKITDMSGKLIYETTALGGQAIWNGKTTTGKRAASGVYMVFIVSPDGQTSSVSKILMLK